MITGTAMSAVEGNKGRCVRAFAFWLIPGLICVLLLGSLGLGINMLDELLQREKLRLMPEVAMVADVAMILALASVPVFAYRMAGRIPGSVKRLSRLKRRLIVVAGLALHTAAAIGCAIILLVSDPDWLFGDSCIDQQPDPGGHMVYLYRGGLFCSYTIYRRDSWDPVLRPVKSIPRERCRGQVYLAIQAPRSVEIVGADGRRLPAQPVDFPGLYWGPH
ncbi:MAG: hypothetical protein ACPG4T_07620 [Nannocystaceae bacterium]